MVVWLKKKKRKKENKRTRRERADTQRHQRTACLKHRAFTGRNSSNILFKLVLKKVRYRNTFVCKVLSRSYTLLRQLALKLRAGRRALRHSHLAWV